MFDLLPDRLSGSALIARVALTQLSRYPTLNLESWELGSLLEAAQTER